MSTGLFTNRTRSHRGPGAKWLARRKAESRRKMLALRDLIADKDMSVAAAANALGISAGHAYEMWAQVKREVEAMGLMVCK